MPSHYGVKIRRLETKALKTKRAKHLCPRCGKTSVKNRSASLWVCSSCGTEFAGGSYSPTTNVGQAAAKALG